MPEKTKTLTRYGHQWWLIRLCMVFVFSLVGVGLFNNQARAVDPTFAPKVDYPVGSSPRAVATADFNADDKIDLAVANYTDGDVSILLGVGDGTFGSKTDYPVGSAANSIVAVDFNADGKVDLATSNRGSQTMSVLLGLGNGSFSPKVDYGMSNTPDSLITSDFNADGKVDVVVTNYDSGAVTVRLGNGDGTFGVAKTSSAGLKAWHLATGDFNTDGKVDLAVTNDSAPCISILPGTGGGTFGTPITVLTGPEQLLSITSVDFNGDGKMDLAVGDTTPEVFVILGNGSNNFHSRVNFPVGINPLSVNTGDLNNDGFADLVMPHGSVVTIRSGVGNGAFGPGTNHAVGQWPMSTAVRDVNGDCKNDLVVANSNSNTVSVLLNTTPALQCETDCGVRLFDGNTVLHFGCVPANSINSKLHVNKSGAIYSVLLVPVGDPNASKVRINTSDGIRALKNYVASTNQPPVLDPIGDQNGAEGSPMSFTVRAADADQATGDVVTITATNLPAGSNLSNTTYNAGSGKFEATFTWTPGYDKAGSYPNIVFTATDTAGATDSEPPITITIANTNRAPVLAAIGNQSGSEGASLSFVINATDPDHATTGEAVTISAAGLPSGAQLSVTNHLEATGVFFAVFTWTPGYTQSNSYPVTFTATDTPGATDSESITITIADVPHCPDTQCNNGETCSTCPADCGNCCGNGACVAPETCSTCPSDCGNCCGNGSCSGGETCTSCPSDCGACFCGDSACNNGETCTSCPGDCGSCCGNGQCVAPETCSNCVADCGACPRRVRRYISAANMVEVENYGTIGAAINDTDTVTGNVLVTDSTPNWYYWNEGQIDFVGKSITLKSQDMIPQHNELPPVVFNGGAGAILEGFYIVGGNNPWGDPAIPYCVRINGNATPTIRNNEIYNCITAGIRVDVGSSATINNNLIHDNCRGVQIAGSATVTWNTIRDGMHDPSNCPTGGPGVQCVSGAPSAVITNNTITQFHTGNVTNGGGISCVANTATISGNNITSNEARYGGGIYFRGSGTITGNTIIGNTAWGPGVGAPGGGGGVDIGGTVTFGTTAVADRNTVTSNITDGPGAGVSAMYNGGTFNISGNTITQNTSTTGGSYGGGIASGGNASTSTTITNNIISNNTTKYSGGGIAHYSGYANISNNLVSYNTAGPTESGGGGIAFAGGGGALIEKNVVVRNTLSGSYGYGGGMLLTVLYDAPGNLINVRNNTIANNTAPGEGGGVFVNNSTNPGACLAQNPVLDSSIVWGNTAPLSPGIGQMSNPWPLCAKVQYSDIQGGWTGFGSNNIPVPGADPKFVNISSDDYRLQASSPCINTGNPALGAGTDMGAFPYP